MKMYTILNLSQTSEKLSREHIVDNYIMAGLAFVVAKEDFYDGNGSILTLW